MTRTYRVKCCPNSVAIWHREYHLWGNIHVSLSGNEGGCSQQRETGLRAATAPAQWLTWGSRAPGQPCYGSWHGLGPGTTQGRLSWFSLSLSMDTLYKEPFLFSSNNSDSGSSLGRTCKQQAR